MKDNRILNFKGMLYSEFIVKTVAECNRLLEMDENYCVHDLPDTQRGYFEQFDWRYKEMMSRLEKMSPAEIYHLRFNRDKEHGSYKEFNTYIPALIDLVYRTVAAALFNYGINAIDWSTDSAGFRIGCKVLENDEFHCNFENQAIYDLDDKLEITVKSFPSEFRLVPNLDPKYLIIKNPINGQAVMVSNLRVCSIDGDVLVPIFDLEYKVTNYANALNDHDVPTGFEILLKAAKRYLI